MHGQQVKKDERSLEISFEYLDNGRHSEAGESFEEWPVGERVGELHQRRVQTSKFLLVRSTRYNSCIYTENKDGIIVPLPSPLLPPLPIPTLTTQSS